MHIPCLWGRNLCRRGNILGKRELCISGLRGDVCKQRGQHLLAECFNSHVFQKRKHVLFFQTSVKILSRKRGEFLSVRGRYNKSYLLVGNLFAQDHMVIWYNQCQTPLTLVSITQSYNKNIDIKFSMHNTFLE